MVEKLRWNMFLDTVDSNILGQLLYSLSDEENCADLHVKRSRATFLASLWFSNMQQ